jgi:hypothetical protein
MQDANDNTVTDEELLAIHGGGSRMTADGRVVSDNPTYNILVPVPGTTNGYTIQQKTESELLASGLTSWQSVSVGSSR